MKKTAVKFLALATALLLLPIALLAHEDPHRGDTYSCLSGGSCHNTHKTLGRASNYSDLCISCHKPGMLDRARIDRAATAVPPQTPEYTYIRPFSYGDQANPYSNDTGLNNAPNKTQNSHKWSGPDTVPEAGALPPTLPAMNPIYPNVPKGVAEKPALIGTLTCYRCHDFSVLRSSPTNSAPFLRGLITADQMCFDCHRSRVTTNSQAGTHPVTNRYSSSVAAKPYEYYSTPRNANQSNPSSQLLTKGGKVVCTTCHGVHYTDSNSFTYDKYSSAVTRQFSTSKGYLLKTDLKRGQSNEPNICMNCHRSTDQLDDQGKPLNTLAQVKNHNGSLKKQNIQCADCHGGHVDFAGYSTAAGGIPQNEKTPNIYLINRFMNITSPDGRFKTIRNAKVIYNDPVNKNANQNAYGVCMACHENGLPATVSQHQQTDWNVCKTCHTHKQGFSADCTTCHGYPPADGTPGGPTGYAATPFNYADPGKGLKSESGTPHMAHAGGGAGYSYKCDECHKGNKHADGNFQDVFKNHTGIIAGLAAKYTYDLANPNDLGTCSTVYCHSDGRGIFKTVTWAGGKGTIINTSTECKSCHDYPATSSGHTRHVGGGTVGKSYACSICHADTVNASGEIIGKSKHVNAVKEVSYSGGIDACSSCHNDGKGGPSVLTVAKRTGGDSTWDYKPSDFGVPANGACGTCHASPMATFGHTAHLTAVYGPKLTNSCNSCHTTYTGELGALHVNGTVEADSSACSPCHPSTSPMPTWSGGRIACEDCHSGATKSVIFTITAPDKSLAPTKGHGKAGIDQSCDQCHAQSAPHIDSDPTVHAFRLLTTLSSGVKPNKACSYCHSDSTKVSTPQFRNMSTHFTVKGEKADMTCWQCHDLHGTTNYRMIKTSFAYANSTTWTITYNQGDLPVQLGFPYRGLCQVCHTKTKYYRAGVQETSHPDSNCYSCHPHNTRGGAFAPFGSCDACHGYPPVPKSAIKGPAYPSGSPLYKQTFGVQGNYTSAKFEDYSGGGGVHLWHVANNKKATDGWGPCAVCHTGGSTSSPATHVARMPLKNNISNVTISIDQRYRFADDSFARYSGASLVNPPAINKTGSCVNVMCHFQPTPRWSVDR